MKTLTRITLLMLLVCLAVGCSTTSTYNTRTGLEPDAEEPFMEDIRDFARKREDTGFYYLGKYIDQEEFERRFVDIVKRREEADITGSSPQFEVVPIILLRF